MRVGPTLDRSAERWRAHLPGLGTVEVDADGVVTTALDPAATSESDDRRERALRCGWGEPLSFMRRGFHLATAAGAVDPATGAALVLRGTPAEVALALIPLCDRGWPLLADWLLPVRFDDGTLVAHPRLAPIVLPRHVARGTDRSSTPVRADTDVVEVDLAQAGAPAPVGALIEVMVRRPDTAVIETLTGHERFETAATLLLSDLVDDASTDTSNTADDPLPYMQRHLLLSRLPSARWSIVADTIDEDLTALLAWWDDNVARGTERA